MLFVGGRVASGVPTWRASIATPPWNGKLTALSSCYEAPKPLTEKGYLHEPVFEILVGRSIPSYGPPWDPQVPGSQFLGLQGIANVCYTGSGVRPTSKEEIHGSSVWSRRL